MKIKKKNFGAYVIYGIIHGFFSLILWLVVKCCKKEQYGPIKIFYLSDDRKFVQLTKEALRFLEQNDNRHYELVCKYLKEIALLENGFNLYFPITKMFMADIDSMDTKSIAAVLVHESVHGILFAKGFFAFSWALKRHEEVCTNVEKRFLKRVTLAECESDEEIKRGLLHIEELYQNKLESNWWAFGCRFKQGILQIKKIMGFTFTHKEFASDGTLLYSVGYVKGARHGSYSINYSNGIKKEEGRYNKGLLHGEVKKYYSSGKIKEILKYHNDICEGPFTYYYENGLCEQDGCFSDGHLHGQVSWYDGSGALTVQANYLRGQLDGICKWYNRNGDVEKEANYILGKMDGDIKYFFKKEKMEGDGVISSE